MSQKIFLLHHGESSQFLFSLQFYSTSSDCTLKKYVFSFRVGRLWYGLELHQSYPHQEAPAVLKATTTRLEGTGTGQRTLWRGIIHPLTKLKIMALFSKKQSPTKRSYNIGNGELHPLKLNLKEWNHWLERAFYPFTIYTDHKNLEYSKRLISNQALFFACFN